MVDFEKDSRGLRITRCMRKLLDIKARRIQYIENGAPNEKAEKIKAVEEELKDITLRMLKLEGYNEEDSLEIVTRILCS